MLATSLKHITYYLLLTALALVCLDVQYSMAQGSTITTGSQIRFDTKGAPDPLTGSWLQSLGPEEVTIHYGEVMVPEKVEGPLLSPAYFVKRYVYDGLRWKREAEKVLADTSKIRISKVVIKLDDVVDKVKWLQDGTMKIPVYWIPKEYGSALGRTYRTSVTEKDQVAFLSQLKSTDSQLNFEKIRQDFIKALVDKLSGAGFYQEISGAMTININLRILQGPWDLADPFASDKREGVLFLPKAAINHADDKPFKKLDVNGMIIEWQWPNVQKAIEIISTSLVQAVRGE